MNELRKYESFKSIAEMDDFLSEALEVLSFSELERKLLRLLAGYSCKFVGVSFLKVGSIATALKVSYKTAQRALRSLKEIGIIKRVRTIRPVRGGFGSSLTVICPIDLSYRKEAEDLTLEQPQVGSERKETFLFKAFHKDLKYIRQQVELDYSYLQEVLPQEFIQAVKPFVSPEEAYSLWSKVEAVSRKYAPEVLELSEPAIRAFKTTVWAYKNGNIRGSFGGYFWGVLSRLLVVEQRRLSNSLWNWLE